jgi:hypothetical protein
MRRIHAAVLCTAGALLMSAATANAAPVPTNTAAVKTAVPSTLVDVRWGWRAGGDGEGVGDAAGGGQERSSVASPSARR